MSVGSERHCERAPQAGTCAGDDRCLCHDCVQNSRTAGLVGSSMQALIENPSSPPVGP
jgi:hypothetical protein